jgi:hypothetical protein
MRRPRRCLSWLRPCPPGRPPSDPPHPAAGTPTQLPATQGQGVNSEHSQLKSAQKNWKRGKTAPLWKPPVLLRIRKNSVLVATCYITQLINRKNMCSIFSKEHQMDTYKLLVGSVATIVADPAPDPPIIMQK